LHFAYLTIFHLTSSLSLESFVPLNEVIETLEYLKNLTLIDMYDACGLRVIGTLFAFNNT